MNRGKVIQFTGCQRHKSHSNGWRAKRMQPINGSRAKERGRARVEAELSQRFTLDRKSIFTAIYSPKSIEKVPSESL